MKHFCFFFAVMLFWYQPTSQAAESEEWANLARTSPLLYEVAKKYVLENGRDLTDDTVKWAVRDKGADIFPMLAKAIREHDDQEEVAH